jgi:hypothetical protein
MPTPDSANILCGTGEVWFDRMNNDGTYAGFRHLGNVSKLDITPTVTVIEKKSSMNATRAVIARAVTETKMELALMLSEFDRENVALALLGTAAPYVQALNAAIVAAPLGISKQGSALDTGKLRITVTDLKMGVTVYVNGVDYTVDNESGLITIVPGGAIVDGSVLTWDGSNAAVASFAMLLDAFKVSMSPDAAIALLGDTFAEIGLKGSVLPDATRPVGQQFVKITYL